jgi:hypothetical protein
MPELRWLKMRIKECGSFKMPRYKWAHGNRHLYYIAYKETRDFAFFVFESFDSLINAGHDHYFFIHRVGLCSSTGVR